MVGVRTNIYFFPKPKYLSLPVSQTTTPHGRQRRRKKKRGKTRSTKFNGNYEKKKGFLTSLKATPRPDAPQA